MPEVVADAIAFVLLLMTDRSEGSRRNRELIALGLVSPSAAKQIASDPVKRSAVCI